MSRNYSPAPAFPPTASAFACATPSVVTLGRPLSLGRATPVALVRPFLSSARRGRRGASADFHSTGVACAGGGFAYLVPRLSWRLRVSGLHRMRTAEAQFKVGPLDPMSHLLLPQLSLLAASLAVLSAGSCS